MPDNPYHPPVEDPHAEDFTPLRVIFFGRANLVFAAFGFGLLIYSKATRKSGFSWSMTGNVQIAPDELTRYLATNRNWVEIEQYYRALEGFLILIPAMFLVSGIALLGRTRWSIVLTHVTAGLAIACCTAFLGVYFTIIKQGVPDLCASLGTEVRDPVFMAFQAGLIAIISYSLIQLRLLTRPLVKNYLEKI
ncbi:hypothetical protein V2O64_05645 [Verrucomicrobiaceae bacterium 227]